MLEPKVATAKENFVKAVIKEWREGGVLGQYQVFYLSACKVEKLPCMLSLIFMITCKGKFLF